MIQFPFGWRQSNATLPTTGSPPTQAGQGVNFGSMAALGQRLSSLVAGQSPLAPISLPYHGVSEGDFSVMAVLTSLQPDWYNSHVIAKVISVNPEGMAVEYRYRGELNRESLPHVEFVKRRVPLSPSEVLDEFVADGRQKSQRLSVSENGRLVYVETSLLGENSPAVGLVEGVEAVHAHVKKAAAKSGVVLNPIPFTLRLVEEYAAHVTSYTGTKQFQLNQPTPWWQKIMFWVKKKSKSNFYLSTNEIHPEFVKKHMGILVLSPGEAQNEMTVAHELGHIYDPIVRSNRPRWETDFLSEAFADFTSFLTTGIPTLLRADGSVDRDISKMPKTDINTAIRNRVHANRDLYHGYDHIHSDSLFFSHLFWRLSQNHGAGEMWRIFYTLRSRQDEYYRNRVPRPWAGELGKMEADEANMSATRQVRYVKLFFEENHPEMLDEVYACLTNTWEDGE